MGYFSRKALEWKELQIQREDLSYPTKRNILQWHLEGLMDKLEEFNETVARDPWHPLFDRYFYENGIVRYYEEPNTVQGILCAIEQVKERIAKQERKLRKEQLFLTSVHETGADPKGQIVFAGIFLPIAEHMALA